MTTVRITGRGTDIDTVIANLRERLDEQLGEGEWELVDDEGPEVVIELSAGGQIASVEVEMIVQGERLSTRTLPRWSA